MEKIGFIVDSGSDVPKEFVDKFEIEVLPLNVAFKDGDYLDGVTIQPQEVFERMASEIPKTSLPSGELISQAFENLI
ncbi:DegV family protein, partial [Aerococcus sp. L_32]